MGHSRGEAQGKATQTQLNGVLFAVGAQLAAVALVLIALLPRVPAEPTEIVAWVEQGRMQLMWADELLFFAVLSWCAGLLGRYARRDAASTARGLIGLAAFLTAQVALVVMLLSLGRLVYPVFGIELSADATALIVSETYGGLHLAMLAFAVAAVSLSWQPRFTRLARGLGVLAAIVFVVGAFPWLTSQWWNVLAGVTLAVWGALLALRHGQQPHAP
ncbi:hypothetical protein [Micropruina sp.]|uniref:hypothetical protein n=1 Tax=Micropruina sp. TaxID=2737536 RepID=UPI0039E2F185